jgi:parallel beta-helix repeat protein
MGVFYSYDNEIIGNIIKDGDDWGISLYESDRNSIINNSISGYSIGINLAYSTDSNEIFNNNIFNNGYGIQNAAKYNNILSNTISGNSNYGIYLVWASKNTQIFHNNFISNAVQARMDSSATATWDDGYPSGGNYWSSHVSVDTYGGPLQNTPGSDGIVDVSYTISVNNIDAYPLVQPLGLHNIAITSLYRSKTVICRCFNLHAELRIHNLGSSNETFTLNVYVNTTLIVTQTVVLEKSNVTTIVLEWNTSDCQTGNYTLSAYADPVQGETDTSDNSLNAGWVMISLIGDITGPKGWPDGKVDMMDVGTVARHFQEAPTSPSWNPNYDINGDNKINMVDVGTVARHFGEH